MNKAFEKILDMLEEKLKKSEERYHRYLDDSNLNLSCMFDRSDIEETRVDTIKEMIEIVKEVAKEYKGGWIACSDRLPEEHDSMFAKLKGTDKWSDAMFEKISDDVNATVEFDDGTRKTMTLHTNDGKWNTNNRIVKFNVIAWQPLPEPFKECD